MRTVWSLCGVLFITLALIAPPLRVVNVAVARAAVAPPSESVPSVQSALSSPTATWTLAPTGTKLMWQSATFAPTVCRLVSFGGTDPIGTGVSKDTWLFEPGGGAWTRIAGTRTSPPARVFAELAWDAAGNRAIMFGGRSGTGAALADTWAFDPATRAWTKVGASCHGKCPPTPQARWGGALVWSSAVRKLVMFGGTRDGTYTTFNDVWTFDTSWRPVTTSGAAGVPSGRFLFGMAEDGATGMLLVYGGATAGITTTHETWQLDPRTWKWQLLATASSPTPDAEVGMTWLPSLGAVVVTGGSHAGGAGIPDTTWALDRTVPTWLQVSTGQPVPSMHLNATLTTDPCHGLAIYLGPPDQVVPPTHTDYTWILK